MDNSTKNNSIKGSNKQNSLNAENINHMTKNTYIPHNRNCYKTIVEICIDLVTMRNFTMENHSLEFISELAKAANAMGLKIVNFLEILKMDFCLSGDEIESIIKTIYEQNHEKFGLLSFFARTNLCYGFQPDTKSSPHIPGLVYDTLPQILKDCLKPLTDNRQQDMFLLSALTVIGGCLENYSGLYDGKNTYPNLYSFVVAPAASGKGVMSNAKRITIKLQDQINEANRKAEQEYKLAMKEYRENDKQEEPSKPVKKILFVPGNSTTAAIVDSFINSHEKLIMFETEADSVASNKGQFNAGFSEILRCAFHHEPYATNRKCNDGVMEIKKPKLSIVLSGTANQVINLINSTENGLFSRFMYYAFDESLTFKNVAPDGQIPDKDKYYEDLSSKFLIFFNDLNKQRTTFSFTNDQWQRFMLKYRYITDIFNAAKHQLKDVNSVITRNAIITFRIAMILTSIRMHESGNQDQEHLCNEDDFEIALNIADTIFAHSIIVLKSLPSCENFVTNTSLLNFIAMLPIKFTRMEAVESGKELNLSPRTCDGYLKQLCTENKIKKLSPGKYQKN